MPNIGNALRQYLELGISRLEASNAQFPASSFGAEVERAISLLAKFNNAVFISAGQGEHGITLATADKFCRDRPGQVRREVFRLDAKQFLGAFGGQPEMRLKEIAGVLENARERTLLVITSLEEFIREERLTKLFQGLIKKTSVPLLGTTTIGGFRQLEKNPELAGCLQFILSRKFPPSHKRNKSVLIIGATSLLGNALYGLFSREYAQVRGTGFSKASSLGFDELDVTSAKEIREYFSKYPDFDIIIYAAGEADADAAEKERDRARILNSEAVSTVARYAKCGKFVYISSEYVFDGSSGPYGSDSPARPINYYGFTKLEGEKAALQSFPEALVVRLGALYGYNGPGDKKTSVSKLIAGLDRPEPLVADNLQVKHPLLLEDAAGTLLKLLDYAASGIYQTNGPEGLNKQEMAEQIAAVRHELTGHIFSYPITGVAQTGGAAKPLNTQMVNVDTPRLFNAGIRFLLLKQKAFKNKDNDGY